MTLPVHIRACLPGETYTKLNTCVVCPSLYYLYDAPSVQTECLECDVNAICLGGDRVAPIPGYWRDSKTS